MPKLGFQLYSLHAVDDPLPMVLDAVSDTGFEGVEFGGLDDTAPATLGDRLSDLGLACAGTHVDLDVIEVDPDAVAATAEALGTDNIVVPWLDSEHFESQPAVAAAAERLDAAAAALADRGLQLHYHNHAHEFDPLDGEPALTHLLEKTAQVGLELDLGWAGAAGQDPLTYLETHAARIDLVHLKDYEAAAGDPVIAGSGDLDIAAAMATARDQGVDWVIYEAEERPDTYDTLDHADSAVRGA